MAIQSDSHFAEPNSTADCIDTRQIIIELNYDDSVRSKFKFTILILGLFFIWGFYFINDIGWLSLGVVLILFIIGFYKFRIDRIVRIDPETVAEKTSLHHWQWAWINVHRIIRKIDSPVDFQHSKPGMERIIIIHESGREIAADSHMANYSEVWKLIWRKSRENNIPVEIQEVPFFILYYW